MSKNFFILLGQLPARTYQIQSCMILLGNKERSLLFDMKVAHQGFRNAGDKEVALGVGRISGIQQSPH